VTLFKDQAGQIVESDESEESAAQDGLVPATPQDIAKHNSDVTYDEKGLVGQAAETTREFFAAADRGAIKALDTLGVDTGYGKDAQGNLTDPAAAPGLFDDEARFSAERHPIAGMAGQAVLGAPVAAATGGAGVLAGIAGESLAGGYASEAENAWLEDREFSTEAALTNVGAGLLVGGGIAGAGALAAKGMGLLSGARRMGRNLLTEAEHAGSARAARDLLDEAGSAGPKATTADEVARRGADDAGVAYIRQNADTLADELATRQAKAAQDLFDAYGEMAPLRQSRDEIDQLIPANPTEQARWLTEARGAVARSLEDLPPNVAAPLRERLSELAEGADPARWFERSSELSDDLLRARAKLTRAGQEGGEGLDAARGVLDEGLGNEGLWGAAARFERQRAAGYAKRYGEHIDDFETAFAADGKMDPIKFRALLDDAADPAHASALRSTLDSAKATADVAARFGRKAEAERIMAAADTLERTAAQGRVIAAARKAVARETRSASARALDWIAKQGADELIDYGIGVASGGLVPKFARGAVAKGLRRAVKGPGLDEKLSAAGRGALERARARAGQHGGMGLSSRISKEAGYGELSGGARGALDHAALRVEGEALNDSNRLAVLQAIDETAAVRERLGLAAQITPDDRRALGALLGEDAAAPSGVQWNARLARKYGQLVGQRGFEGGDEALSMLVSDETLAKLGAGGELQDAFERGVAEGERVAAGGAPVKSRALETLRRRRGQGGAMEIGASDTPGRMVRRGQWSPETYWDRVADAEFGAFDDLESLGGSGMPSEAKEAIKKQIFDDLSDRLELEKSSDLNSLRRSVAAAADDVDWDASVAPAYRKVFGEDLPSEAGSMRLGAGPNFTLGDVAASPAGVVTGLGVGALGARELYLAQQDEARQGAFQSAVGMARNATEALRGAVRKLLSPATLGGGSARDTIKVEPPKAPLLTMSNFDATRDHIDRLSRDPDYFGDTLANSFGSMPEAAPEVFSALSAQAAGDISYLAAVAPGGSSGGPFGQRIPVSTDDLWEFNERFRAIADPDYVTEELGAGRLSSQAIEAFEQRRPQQYARLQQEVFARLGELNEAGIPVTVAAREQLDVLLNIDGGGDPALTWKVAERAYAAQARKASAASAIDAPSNQEHVSAMTSGALSTLSNGASAIAQTG